MSDSWQQAALRRLELIFRDHFLDDSIALTEASSPEDIEEWDSLAHVNLLAAVEAEFGLRFTADEMGDIADVATLLAALRRKSAPAA